MPEEPDRLSTWGEISEFLHCTVRTAQRWERERTLPVHRIPGGQKHSVFAYRQELQAWLDRDPIRPASPVSAPAGPDRAVSRRTAISLAAGGLALAGGGVWLSSSRPGEPARATFAGSSLCAWDAMGRLVWKHTFTETFRDQPPVNYQMGRTILIGDLGSGSKSILFIARFAEADGITPRDELFCFSPAGNILWRYRPAVSLTFGDTLFQGPWTINDMLVGAGENPAVWLAMSHWIWRPGVLLALDRNGHASVRFVSAGNIYVIAPAHIGEERYVLAGGVNNEYAAASLAVVREKAPPAAAPQTKGTPYECVDGPKGLPERYFLFPPTELTAAASQPYNTAISLTGLEREVTLITAEVGRFTESSHARALYRLSPKLEVVDLAFDNDFAVQHQAFEKSGAIRHTLAACPLLRSATAVRRWDAESGWTSVSVFPRKGVGPA